MRLRPGEQVDRYEVEALLGRGTGSEVYRVRHRQLGTLRALKLCPDMEGPQARALLQEGRVQAELRHPNLVAVLDVLEVHGSPALLMEYVRGPTLRELVQDAPPQPEQALRLFREAVAGVAEAHRAGLVHRDLKPDNVVLDLGESPPRARVMDFGLACLEASGAPRGGVGTLGYCAPEQLRGQPPTPAADVFALGVLFYELCSGRPPYPQADRQDLISAMEAGRHQPLGELRPELPDALVDLIEACLEGRASRRPPDAEALEVALGGGASRPSRAPRAHLALPLALGLGLLGVLGWGLHQRGLAEAASLRAELSDLEVLATQLRERDPGSSLALRRAMAQLQGRSELPAREAAALLHSGAAVYRLDRPGAITLRVALGEDLVALADSEPSLVRVLERHTGELVVELDTGLSRPMALGLDEGGRWLVVTASADPIEASSPVAAWALPSGSPLVNAPAAPAWARAPEGRFDEVLLSYDQSTGERRLELRELPSGELRWRTELNPGDVAQISPDASRVFVPGSEGFWDELDARDGSRVRSWASAGLPLSSPSTSVTGLRAAGQGLELHDGERALTALPGAAARIAFSSDGSVVAAVDDNERLEAVSVRSGAQPLAWPEPSPARIVHGIDRGFLVGTSDGRVQLWRPGSEQRLLRGLLSRIIAFSAQGAGILAGDLSGGVALWDEPDRHVGSTTRLRSDPVGSAWSERVDELIALGPEGLVALRPGAAPELLSPLQPGASVSQSLVLGQRLVLLGPGGQRSVELPSEVRSLRRGLVRVDGGTLLATAHQVVLVDDDGRVVRSEVLPQISRMVPHPEGALLAHGATASFSVLDAGGQLLRSGHAESEQAISSISVQADGSVVVGTFCGRLLRFDAGGPEELAKGPHPVSALAEEGGRIATGDWYGHIEVRDEGGLIWTFELGEQAVDAAWTERGLVVADAGGMLTWFSSEGRALAVRKGHEDGKVWLRVEDGVLWSYGSDGLLQSWDGERVLHESATLERSGSWTNLRVCRDSHAVVPVLPYPSPETVWAPEELCGG